MFIHPALASFTQEKVSKKNDFENELHSFIYIVDSIEVPFFDNQGYKMGSPMSERTRKDLEAFDPTVVHVTVPDLLGRDAMYWGEKNDIPVIATYHSNYADYQYRVFSFPLNLFMWKCCQLYLINIYTQIKTTYVPTKDVKKKLQREGFQFRGVNSLEVWGRSIDSKVFRPLNMSERVKFRKTYGIPLDSIVVLWVGRVVKEKSIHLWLETVKRLKLKFDNLIGLVVGEGTETSIFQPYSSYIKCMGWISEPEKLRLVYGSADVMFFPSSVETFGNVTLEAMACGLPVVVDERCSRHLVSHEKSGFCVKSLDENSYVNALSRLIQDPELRLKFGQVGHEKALTYICDHGDIMIRNYIKASDLSVKKTGKNRIRHLRSMIWNGFDYFVFICTFIFFGTYFFFHDRFVVKMKKIKEVKFDNDERKGSD